MNFRKITAILMLVLIAGLIIYDVIAIKFGQRASISVWVWEHSETMDLIPFGFGFLMGHFFFPRHN